MKSPINFFLYLIGWSIPFFLSDGLYAQTQADSVAIRQAALDYIESQHVPDAAQMERALHPRLVKRTFWFDKTLGKDILNEANMETMLVVAAKYNSKGDKFPAKPVKEVKLLDVSDRTASVKLTADEWIDYMHLVKVNGAWKVVNVLWQYHDSTRHVSN